MRAPAARIIAVACAAAVAIAGCGGSGHASSAAATNAQPRSPLPAPEVTLTAEEQRVWAPLPADRSAIPVLLYHGVGPESDFSNAGDAQYGVDVDAFARQMTLIKHAGYTTIGLQTFIDFVQGKRVELPPRPLLLTFDDGRLDSWTGADGILEQLGFSAVMFVDTGRVGGSEPEYLTWGELGTLEQSGRWDLQLHAGPNGHEQIHYAPGPNDYGAYYAYQEQHEDFDGWRERTRSDIEQGQHLLSEQVPAYRPLAFAPPYGNYGQEGTNDERIPSDLLGWLKQRYDAIFTQDVNARARPDSAPPYGRVQVTRATTAGMLHELLLSGKQ